MQTRLPLLPAVLVAALAWPASAAAVPALLPLPETGLWASINKCDTAAAPDTVGVRGSMPPLLAVRSVASMRFRVQFRRSDGSWEDAGPQARSRWTRLGPITDRVLESGQDFTFKPPPGGGRHVLRGVVDFRWARKGKVLRRATRISEAGHPSSAGGDPAGYSAATCVIR